MSEVDKGIRKKVELPPADPNLVVYVAKHAKDQTVLSPPTNSLNLPHPDSRLSQLLMKEAKMVKNNDTK
jgi:hypothetical protein